jgi:glycosyltransferase involved in cell wall biosynthesis
MKVLYIFQSDFTSPGEKLFFYMANELARCGHESMVLVNGAPETVRTMSQTPAFEYERLAFQGRRLARGLFEKIDRFKPDVVHAQYIRNEPFQAGLAVKRRFGIPLIVHHDDAEDAIFQMRFQRWWEAPISRVLLAAGTWVHPRWWHWYNPGLKTAEREIDAHDCLTQALKLDIRRRCGLEAEHLYLGLDVDFFQLPPQADKSHLPPGIKPDDFVVMYNGSLHRYTLPDFEMLLDAIVVARRKNPKIRLVYSGSNFRQAEVAHGIQKRGLSEAVTSLGLVPTMSELRDHFAYADVFVQPGKNTRFNELRFPSKLMFYLAAGRPIITLDFGFGRLLTQRKDALLYQDYRAEGIADLIRWVYEQPALAWEIGRRAVETARRLFDVKKTTQQYLRLYERVLAGKDAVRGGEGWKGVGGPRPARMPQPGT